MRHAVGGEDFAESHAGVKNICSRTSIVVGSLCCSGLAEKVVTLFARFVVVCDTLLLFVSFIFVLFMKWKKMAA